MYYIVLKVDRCNDCKGNLINKGYCFNIERIYGIVYIDI